MTYIFYKYKFQYFLLTFSLLIIKSRESNDNDFIILKNKNSSICDLKITTDNLVIFDKCILSYEWNLNFEKTSSQNSLEVYEKKETTRRVFNIEYVIDPHKSQQDIKFNNITVKVLDKDKFMNYVYITNPFPMSLKKGDNFDVIIEYDNYNLTYVNLVISIFMVNNIDSKVVDLYFGYRKILSDEFIRRVDLSYLFLILIFIIFIFLLRLKFLVEENQFIKIHIDEIIQGENAETIFVVVGIVVTIFLFFIIIKYIYYITFIFSILLAILSVKSFFKYLFKIILPCTAFLEIKYIEIKSLKFYYSNILFYPMSALILLIWYYITDSHFYLHTFLNDLIFFIIVYFNVHKLNLKNFYIIMIISFTVIFYQLIKIILDENIVQKDDNNVYYITTRFFIDVPIRFILKDLVDSPYEEIYYFSMLDIILIGFVIHYCEDTYHLSKIYLMISIYGTIIGLIINMILFYGFSFSPPMSIIPLFLSIVSLLIYSIWQKQFFDFVDLEAKEDMKDLQEIVKIQEIQDIPGQIDFLKKNDISFNENMKSDNKLFEEEKNLDDLKDYLSGDDSDEEEKKKHENMINEFNERINLNNIARNNNRRMTVGNIRDSVPEKAENLFDLEDGTIENKDNNYNKRAISKKLTVDPKFMSKFLFNKNKEKDKEKEKEKDKEMKMVEMKEFDEKSD